MQLRKLVFFLVVLFGAALAVPYQKAECQRYQSCNGQMCADICEIGTVVLDPWVTETLSFQRMLQLNRTVVQYEVPGTHNGAIAQDYEMGIEEEYLYNLLLPIYGPEKSVVVIANQRHSLYDQLRMGVRHLEVDIYHFDRLGGFKICHWPVCPPDFYAIVVNAAKRQGIELDWDCGNLGCDERKPFYVDILKQIRLFLDLPENKNEIVTIYIDNKNVGVDLASEFVALNEQIMGDIAFRPTHKNSDYPDRWPTIAELLAKGRRVVFEQQNQEWKNVPEAEALFFTPTLWNGVQVGPEPQNFQPFPSCLIEGNDNYNVRMSRSLDGSLTLGPAFLWEGRTNYPLETVNNMTDCSVQVQSLDQVGPAAMEAFVWTWERNEPNSQYSCTLLNRSGRWETADCNSAHRAACVSTRNELDWIVSSSYTTFAAASCPSGYVFSHPVAGRMNSVLTAAAAGQFVWLNYRT